MGNGQRLLTLSRAAVELLRAPNSKLQVTGMHPVASLCGKRARGKEGWSSSSAAVVGAAVAAFVGSVGAAQCDVETPLQRLQLDMLRQWIITNGGDMQATDFHSVQVRTAWCKVARCTVGRCCELPVLMGQPKLSEQRHLKYALAVLVFRTKGMA